MRPLTAIVVLALTLAACVPAGVPAQSDVSVVATAEPDDAVVELPDLSQIDVGALSSELTPVDDLDTAGQQMAAALGVAADTVRARIQARACTTCAAQTDSASTSVAGIVIAEAVEKLQAGDTFWLVVGRLTCTYQYDGILYTPQSCQVAPL